MEERGSGGATEEEEGVVGDRGEVRGAPGLEGEAVGMAAKGEGEAVGEVGVMKGEGAEGVVDVEDSVGSGREVEHEVVVNTEKEVAEARVAAPEVEGERVVHCQVAAVGTAGDVGMSWWC